MQAALKIQLLICSFYAINAFIMPTKQSFVRQSIISIQEFQAFGNTASHRRRGFMVSQPTSRTQRAEGIHMSKKPSGGALSISPKLVLSTLGALGALYLGTTFLPPDSLLASLRGAELSAPTQRTPAVDLPSADTSGVIPKGSLDLRALPKSSAAKVKLAAAGDLVKELKELRKDLEVWAGPGPHLSPSLNLGPRSDHAPT
jgi:hypothetical protein